MRNKQRLSVQLLLCCIMTALCALSVNSMCANAKAGGVPLFIGNEMTAEQFGKAAAEIALDDPETGTSEAIRIHGNSRDYGACMPADDPGYEAYIWRIYVTENCNARIGGKFGVDLKVGWNSVVLTWDQLNGVGANGAKNFYINDKSDFKIICLGSLMAVTEYPVATFLGTEMKPTDFGTKGEAAYVILASGGVQAIKAIQIGGTDRDYTSLLPANDPGYDVYEWSVYLTKDSELRIGGKSGIAAKQGWNKVTLTWKELVTNKNFYAAVGNSCLYLGDLTGVNYPVATFLGTEMKPADFGAKGEAKYVTVANADGQTIKAIQIGGADRDYTSLLPANDPGYDVYEWNVYLIQDSELRIGGKSGIAAKQGWNKVTLTWKELVTNKNFYVAAGNTRLYLGSLVGKEIHIKTNSGASIRFSDNGGIRFTSSISIVEYNDLKNDYTVSFGMLILPTKMSGSDNLNVNTDSVMNFEFDDNKKYADGDSYMFNAAIVGIPETDYGTELSARAYVKLICKDGTVMYIYADYSAENNSRSIKAVATAALADTEATYSDAQKALLNKFAGVNA